MTSTLSSDLVLLLALWSSRFSIVCSEHARNITKPVLTLELISLFHFYRFSKLRGNPSIKNLVCDELCLIALCRRETVMKLGTIFPLMMVDWMSSPCSEDGFFLSSRSSYPADKCLQPKCFSINEDCVPFPQQGPPKMNETAGFKASVENPQNGLIQLLLLLPKQRQSTLNNIQTNVIIIMSKLQLSQILGSSATKASHLAFVQDCLLYPSGSYLIFYNPVVDEQICYLRHTSPLISSLCASPCEQYLAVCSATYQTEKQKTLDSLGRKSNNVITIYKLGEVGVSEPTLSLTLKGHKHSIDHALFSPDSKFLVTVSNKDGSMFVWDCSTGERLTQNKNSKPVNAIKFIHEEIICNPSRKQFPVSLVTIGRGNCKVWSFANPEMPGLLNRVKDEQHWILSGRHISLNKKFATKQFVEVCFWQSYILLLSSDGLLCLVNRSENDEKLEKCIDLMITKTTSMDTLNNVIMCGGDNALIKIIDLESLSLLSKFPKPPPINKQNIAKDYEQEEQAIISYEESEQFPRCVCIKTIGRTKFSQFVVSLYENLTMFIWRPEPQDMVAMRSIITHRASIKSVKILEEFKNDLTFFGTISEDQTLRIWHIYKKCIYNRQSIDIAELIGIKRNAYCRNLTRIIYMESEKEVTCISSFSNKSLACIAHREFIMYSLQNFEVTCHEVLDCDAAALEIKDNIAYVALENGRVVIYEIVEGEDRLHKIRQIEFQNKIRKMKVLHDEPNKNEETFLLIETDESEEVILYSLKKSKVVYIEKSVRCSSVSGRNIFICRTDNTIVVYNILKQKSAPFLSLKHELSEPTEVLVKLSCSLLWIVAITSLNRLIVCNFSPTVVCTEQINETINDIAIGSSGEVILVGDFGNIFVYRIQGTHGYSSMEQEVKKWMEKNDMSWMDGSVWAQRKSSESQDRQLAGSVVDSIRLKSSLSNRGSMKLELPNMEIKYKSGRNDESVFNPSHILQQAKQIYNQIDGIEKKHNNSMEILSSPKQVKTGKQGGAKVSIIDYDNELEEINMARDKYSKPPTGQLSNKALASKKRIFGQQSKSQQSKNEIPKTDDREMMPEKFRNNLVNSIIHISAADGQDIFDIQDKDKQQSLVSVQASNEEKMLLGSLLQKLSCPHFQQRHSSELVRMYQMLSSKYGLSVENREIMQKSEIKSKFEQLSKQFLQFLDGKAHG